MENWVAIGKGERREEEVGGEERRGDRGGEARGDEGRK
ncbi:hypothetical protein Pcinc_037827, partial [Petrolisthes cinctipes]